MDIQSFESTILLKMLIYSSVAEEAGAVVGVAGDVEGVAVAAAPQNH